jgi:hypothetical protein
VVLSGDPFEVQTRVEQVWIAGEPVDLDRERELQRSQQT